MENYGLSQWVIFFFLYSFIGWVWESCYVSVRKHRWVNRGFMNGPFLPLYGSGALVILVSTMGVRDNVALIFIMGLAGATVLEYFTGAAMERLFRVRYWDYSRQKFNLNGYICLTSSLCWGLFSVLMVKVVHVPVERFVLRIPLIASEGLAFVLLVYAAVDFTQSFNEAMDLKRVLIQLEESREQIRKMQEKLRVATAEAREDYRKYSEAKALEKMTKKALYLERLELRRAERRRQLAELADRVDTLLREELPAKVDELIGEERRQDLYELKENIMHELQKMGSRTDRNYLRIARHLRRNPTAVSEKFKEALEELRKFTDIK